MNHAYRLVFNQTLGRVQVAPETARSRSKGAKAILGSVVSLGLSVAPCGVLANVFIDGGAQEVVSGTDGGTQSSPWVIAGNLFNIGSSGDGALRIEDGGTVSSDSGTIGTWDGAQGEVLVTGAGSSWRNASVLSVGFHGTGTLSIEDGGTVSSDSGMIGTWDRSHGEVAITGAGSNWVNTNVLTVGSRGRGVLRIEDGGSVHNEEGRVGFLAGSSGEVLITGAGSKWLMSGVDPTTWRNNLLAVGFHGDGMLSIEDGGSVSSGYGQIGYGSGAQGKVSVIGAGSTWMNAAPLAVGAAGSGVLHIDQGGSVTNGYGIIAQGPRSQGKALITGIGSIWNTEGLDVAREGRGVLRIKNGGSVISDFGIVGQMSESYGDVLVTGAGSSWWNASSLVIGSAGTGVLRIEDDAKVSSRYGTVGAKLGSLGDVQVTGAGSSWRSMYELIVGLAGTGTLSIEDGGTVSSDFGTVGYEVGAHGGLSVTGAGSSWSNRNSLAVGLYGDGTLHIENGGSVSSGYGTLGAHSESSGEVLVTGAGSTWINMYDVTIGVSGSGILRIEDGGVVDSDEALLGLWGPAYGKVVVKGTDSVWRNSSSLVVGSSGTGVLHIEDGGLVHSGHGVVGDWGVSSSNRSEVVVTGEVSTWANANVLSIGSAGTGTLRVENGGQVSVAGGNNPVIVADGTASAGTLVIGGAQAEEAVAAGRVLASALDFGDGAATLVFNHTEKDYSFDPVLNSIGTGAHAIQHLAGDTKLTGDSAGFTGTTIISGGRLLIGNTTLGGNLFVNDGGLLGGSGAVGSTAVAGGGRLSPDSSTGTLNVSGNLTLFEGSILEYELGSPGDKENPYKGVNGRINVRDDLKLNGKLNLSRSDDVADGVPGHGYYRLMTYGGDLTGPGLTVDEALGLGSQTGYEIQTDQGTVDLFVGVLGDNTLPHWIGGDGVWSDVSSSWINRNGEVRTGWSGNHAVFKSQPNIGKGGAISVEGSQTFKGLQFVDEGYRLKGPGVLQAHADGAEIRVLADRAEVAARISGAGGIYKTEAGTLALSAMNTYRGGTTLSAGVVEVSSDSNLGAADGGLSFSGGTLTSTESFSSARTVSLNGSGGSFKVAGGSTLGLSGNLSGAGSMNLIGAGNLLFTGDGSDFSGQTTVSRGKMLVGDAGGRGVLGGNLVVDSGGILGGSGAVGSTVVRTGGFLSPGNSVGELTINGDLTFEPGSTLAVEVNPILSVSDHVNITGTATLAGTVSHIGFGEAQSYAPNSQYRILTAGAVNGEFDQVISAYTFLDPSLSYETTGVDLKLVRNDISFADSGIASTRNQRAVGGGIGSLTHGHGVYDAIVSHAGSDGQLRNNYDQLSGELHASAQGALIEDSRLIRMAANDRLRAASGSTAATIDTVETLGSAAWVRVIGNWGGNDGNSNAASLDRETKGIVAGVDTQLSEYGHGGVLLGHTRSDIRASRGRGSADVDSTHFGVYGSLQLSEVAGDPFLRGGAFYGHHEIDSKRSVHIGPLNNLLKDERTAHSLHVYGEMAYQIDAGSVILEPFANLAHVHLRSTGSTEKGGDAALRSSRETTDTSYATIGVRPSVDIKMSGIETNIYGSAGWRHAFGDATPKSEQRFSGAADKFSVAGVPIARNAAAVEAGVRLELGTQTSFDVSYSGQYGDGMIDHGGRATLEWRF